MSSNLRVNNILPSVGTNVAIGTAGGSITLTGTVSGSSNINVGAGASVYSPTTNVLALGTNNAERVRITSSGNIGIGTDNPQKKFVVSGGAQGVEISPAESGISRLLSYNRNTSAYTSLQIEGYDINFIRDGGVNAAKITSGGNVQIANGNLVFSTAGTGIDFSATANSSGGTMTSELLNDYEEGTWTPYWSSYTGTNLFVDNTITIVHANYVKINKMIIYSTYFTSDGSFSYNTAGGMGGSTPAYIGGLPFVSSGYHAGSTGYFANWTGYDTPAYGYNPMIISNDAVSTLRLQYPSTNGGINITASSLLYANSAIIVSGVYFTS